MEEIKRFNEAVKSSNEMQEEIKTIGNDLEKLVSYANDKGYQFSLSDINAMNRKKDLSDEELDSVAGGGTVAIFFAVAKVIVI